MVQDRRTPFEIHWITTFPKLSVQANRGERLPSQGQGEMLEEPLLTSTWFKGCGVFSELINCSAPENRESSQLINMAKAKINSQQSTILFHLTEVWWQLGGFGDAQKPVFTGEVKNHGKNMPQTVFVTGLLRWLKNESFGDNKWPVVHLTQPGWGAFLHTYVWSMFIFWWVLLHCSLLLTSYTTVNNQLPTGRIPPRFRRALSLQLQRKES